LLVAILATLVAGGVAYASIVRDLPDPGEKPKGRDQTSVIQDRNGEELVKLFAEQNRTDIALADIPADLKNAVIATEDKRYYEHIGVDPIGIARALWVDVSSGRSQGGSTITQQYVKNAIVTPERTLKRKVMEAILAYRVEKAFDKDEILELYLNTIYFGHGAYGVETAAHTYFGKPVAELDLSQSALLAGIIKSPGRYSPYMDPEAAQNRRATVLGLMLEQEYINTEAHQTAAAAEIVVAGLPDTSAQAPYFVEYIKAQLTERYGAEMVFRGGISVKTTLDLRLQHAAEAAVAAVLDQADDPSAALVALDPTTGEILAMVGGRDFATQQFNVAVQGRRQPGSAFKPFVLATALAQGTGSEEVFDSRPASFGLPNGQTWKVTGSNQDTMRLRAATEKSINSVFAKMILDVGADSVVETASRMGITEDVTPVPAIALGGLERGVSPLEMAAAYGTLAAGGTAAIPYGLSEVTDGNGKVLHSAETSASAALDPAVAYLTTDMLKGVITRGTGTAAGIGRPAAGKTGTTQEYRDAWFVGYTPQIVCAVWVGYPEAAREMNNVHGRKVTGGSFPAEIWARFMKAAHEGLESRDFTKPSGLTQVDVCATSGQRAGEWCEEKTSGLYLSAHLPGECPEHTGPVEIEIPNVIGMTKENALAKLKGLLLQFNVVEQDVKGIPAGIVASQDPAGGGTGTVETVVTIVVSNGGGTNKPPTADFTAPEEGVVGQAVTFDGSTSADEDGVIATYLWEFGDGTKGQGRTIEHVYESPGTYEVTLWVTDDRNHTASTTRQLLIR
jgi:penicillin-binding protein 1A